MKNTDIYILTTAVAAAAALSGCDDNFTRPPMVMPEGVDPVTTTTIAEFKPEFWQFVEGTPQQVGYMANGDTVIFEGRVASSDETGNIYKNIIIQAVDTLTGKQWALTFAVNNNKLYQTYKFGQKVAVYASDLTVGGYRGLMQFGTVGDKGMGFMDDALFTKHVKVMSGLPSPAQVDTAVTTVSALNAAKTNQTELMMWQSRLVRVDGVRFEAAGQPFAGSETTNRYIKDADGNKLIVRTSAYASFKNELCPEGVGSVAGILSYFGSDWQILLIDAYGCIGFDGTQEPDKPVDPDKVLAQVTEDFNASTEIPQSWTEVKVAGDKSWYVREFNGNNYATVSGYNGKAPFDSWLISPAVDLSKSPAKLMSFISQVNGYGSKTSALKVYVLSSANPAKAEKTELKPALPTAPDNGYSSWVKSGELDLSSFSGVVYIGFQYSATQDENYATWCVDDVNIGCKAADKPVEPSAGEIYSSLPESAEALPEGWIFENVALDGLESIWKWEVYNGKGYIKATAYKEDGKAVTEAYAVSPVIDLGAYTGCAASFDHAAKFQTTIKTLCGICVREEGAKEWTSLTVPVWPTAGSWTFANSGNVDLKAYDGKKVQIAFKYASSTDGADTWEVKNLKVTGTKK